MQADGKKKIRSPWIWVGFGIGLSVSLLAYAGIAGLLYLIRQFQLPEEELAIFTSLFYGIVFFIALGGVRAESRRHKLLVTGKPYAKAPPDPESETETRFGRFKTVLWYVFTCFSLGWLTPALMIYWADPRHPDLAVAMCAYFFSLAAGTIYVLKRAENIGTKYNHVILYVGICLGAFLMDRAIGLLCP